MPDSFGVHISYLIWYQLDMKRVQRHVPSFCFCILDREKLGRESVSSYDTVISRIRVDEGRCARRLDGDSNAQLLSIYQSITPRRCFLAIIFLATAPSLHACRLSPESGLRGRREGLLSCENVGEGHYWVDDMVYCSGSSVQCSMLSYWDWCMSLIDWRVLLDWLPCLPAVSLVSLSLFTVRCPSLLPSTLVNRIIEQHTQEYSIHHHTQE